MCILPEQDTYVVATSHHVSFVYRLNVSCTYRDGIIDVSFMYQIIRCAYNVFPIHVRYNCDTRTIRCIASTYTHRSVSVSTGQAGTHGSAASAIRCIKHVSSMYHLVS